MKNIILTLLLILFIQNIQGNDNEPEIITSTYIDSIYYRISEDDISIGKIIDFRFPPLEMNQPYTMKGIVAKKINKKHSGMYGCKLNFANPIFLKRGKDSKLNIKLYTNNVDTLFFSVGVKASQYVKNINMAVINLQRDLKYYDFTFGLDYLFQGINDKLIDNNNLDSLPENMIISSFTVSTNCKNKQKLIIGDIVISAPVEIKSSSEQGFKQKIINHIYLFANNLKYNGLGKKQIKKNLSLYEESGVEFLTHPITTELKNLSDTLNEREKVKLVSNSVKNILIDYFENSENQNKKLLLEFDSLSNSSICLDSFYSALEPFLFQLHDTHFKLINTKKEKKLNVVLPIHFYKILDQIQVVTILDTTLNKVTLGDELIEVNNRPINKVVEELGNRTSGTNYHSRESKVIQKLLYELYDYLNDTLHLKLRDALGETYSIDIEESQIMKNKNIFIPPNVRAKQKIFDYQKIDDFAYLRIGTFQDYTLRPFFYSFVDSIMASKGLIIDLRNNPTSDFSLSFFLSFFINTPVPVFSNSITKNTLETIMINPDPFYYYKNPIVILFDSRTTCGSEYFIKAILNARNDVVTIGATRTSGSAQHANHINLPKAKNFEGTLMYRSNILYNSTGNNIDENGGMAPMIWTYYKSYYDLAPYNDKLLQYGIKYLDKVKETKARNQQLSSLHNN